MIQLTETLYQKGHQCPKYLWFQVYKPEFLDTESPDREWGRGDGEKARRLAEEFFFPHGTMISAGSMDKRRKQTEEFLGCGACTLFEAVFEHSGCRVVIDVLEKDESGRIALHGVKSVTRIRKAHIRELSFQYHVLTELGFSVDRADIICLNKSYTRLEDLDPEQLFLVNDYKKEVEELQKPLTLELEEQHSLLKGPCPGTSIGTHCTTPGICEARNHCWKDIPAPSVFDISTLSPELKMKFYRQGIVEFHQIEDVSELSDHQRLQVESELSGKTSMNKTELTRFLSSLSFPISHLDFEAFQQAVPLWEGSRPYAHIPFQYSLHLEDENGTLDHREFLAPPGQDPRRQLAENLIKDIPAEGSVLVYNQAFEKGILKSLASGNPDLAPSLENIIARLADLMMPFKNKYLYSPVMKGKYSIKSVLPALVPDMADAYGALNLIHNGLEAMHLYSEMKTEENEKREALLKYCELDTLAMVKILKELRKRIR